MAQKAFSKPSNEEKGGWWRIIHMLVSTGTEPSIHARADILNDDGNTVLDELNMDGGSVYETPLRELLQLQRPEVNRSAQAYQDSDLTKEQVNRWNWQDLLLGVLGD